MLTGKVLLRKVLVVVQFSISIILIIATILIFRQLELIQTRSHGFTRDQILVIDIPRDRTVHASLHGLKNAIIRVVVWIVDLRKIEYQGL